MQSQLLLQKIKLWIAQGEHQQQDFKFEISDSRKIAKTLSAFANTNGGRLLIGVKDNGRIAGVRSEEEEYMIEAAARRYCSPQVSYSMQTVIVDGRSVLVVEVDESDEKPIYALDEENKKWAYLRVADENILATTVHLCIWQQNISQNDECLALTEKELLLLDMLKDETLLSLNRYCRKTKMSRRKAEHLLAKFIRYEIVESVFQNHHFYYKLK